MARTQNFFPQNPPRAAQPYIPPAKNADGYPAFRRTQEEQYLQQILTNRCDNTFYADAKDNFDKAEAHHNAMLVKDPHFMAGAIQFARKEGFMRMQPIFGLFKLSCLHPDLFAQAYNGVIRIPDDVFDFLTIMNADGRGEGGRAVKRMNAAFCNKISEYWAIKYNGRGRGYNLTDLIRTCHPKPENEQKKAIFAYLLGKDCNPDLLPQIVAAERLKLTANEDEVIKLIGTGRLPHEFVTGAVNNMTPRIWDALVPQMPLFALLRNINTLQRAGVLDQHRDYVSDRLSNAEAIKKAKVLPFRFLTAYNAIGFNGVYGRPNMPWLEEAICQGIENTFVNLPDLPEDTHIEIDRSGSMNGERLMVAALLGIGLWKKSGGKSDCWLFDTKLLTPNWSRQEPVLRQAAKVTSGGGTDTSVGLRQLYAERRKVSTIILLTDEQQNTGNSFFATLKHYRRDVNPDVKVFIIDVAHEKGAMAPPDDDKTFMIYGWSDQVLKYISWGVFGYGTMADAVRQNYVNKVAV